MGATVLSGVDARPVFEAPEHVFDFVALLVEEGVFCDRFVGFERRDLGLRRLDAFFAMLAQLLRRRDAVNFSIDTDHK